MSSMAIGLVVFASVFGGAIVGMLLRAFLPANHLNAESKDIVKVGTGLIGTMAALVLGLLVASAKESYDTEKSEVTQLVADVTLLDRILAHYGTQAVDARKEIRRTLARAADRLWSEGTSTAAQPTPATKEGDTLYEIVQRLSPANDEQRSILSQAQGLCIEILRTRLLLSAQRGTSILLPLLIVLVFWETAVFLSFGLFAPTNATVIITLLVCALSVSSAMFLMLELDHPFSGLIQISSEPLRNALAHLGQ
jgi:hypothetical protein